MVGGVAGAFAERRCFAGEQDGVQGFRYGYQAGKDNTGPDDQDVEGPAPTKLLAGYPLPREIGYLPCGEGIDEPSNQGTEHGTQEWGEGVEHHWSLDLGGFKQICYRPGRDTQERTPRYPIQESSNDNGLDVLRCGLGDQEHDEKEDRYNIDRSSAIELGLCQDAFCKMMKGTDLR